MIDEESVKRLCIHEKHERTIKISIQASKESLRLRYNKSIQTLYFPPKDSGNWPYFFIIGDDFRILRSSKPEGKHIKTFKYFDT